MSLSSPCLPVAMILTPDQREQTGETSGTALHLGMLIALYAIPIVVAVRAVADPVIDPDIWWHLRVGQWVVEHHAVPATDPFSRYGADRPWIAYSWLYEILVFRLYKVFGLAGIVAYRVAMSLAVVAALHRLVRRREPRFLVATGLTAVSALAMAPLFSERPWLFTVLFTTLTLDVLLDLRAGQASRWIWLLPFAFVLWANLHIQFVYGLLLLGLACVAPGIDALLVRRLRLSAKPQAAFSWRVVLLTGLCLLATLANPYHGQLYRVVVEYATQSGPFHCVNELRALEFRETSDWVMLLLGGAGVFALGRRRRLGSFEVLLLACAGVLAFRSRRELWFLVLAAVAILATQHRRRAAGRCREPSGTSRPARLAGPTDASAGRCREPSGTSVRLGSPDLPLKHWIAIGAALTVLVGLVAWQRGLSEENIRRKVAGVFPVEAAAVVAARGYTGPLYNDFNWGGFLIWSLPQLPVLLDGRTNLHGDERILRIGNTWAAGPGWRDDPDLAAAGVVIADAQSPLGCVLVLDDRFQIVYEDRVARVFVRRQSGSLNR